MALLEESVIQSVRNTATIVDIVSDYVSLRRMGSMYKGLCPFHNEKTPSFIVTPARNICKCFGCGEGGDPITFVRKIERVGYIDAIRILAKKYNIEIKEKVQSAEEIQRQSEHNKLLGVNDWLQEHFIHNMNETEEGKTIGLTYFLQRGIREDTIKKFKLGYAINNYTAYTGAYNRERGDITPLVSVGATVMTERGPYDRFAGRAMFPIHSISGKVVAFGGRAIKKADNIAKYQNSPESDVYHKKENLYGVFFARNAIMKQGKCYIVEGYCDVISMHQAGVENIVAPCGTALTKEQIRFLKRILPSVGDTQSEEKYVTMLYDGDKAGLHAAMVNGKLMLEEGLNVSVVVLPPEDDPDTFAQNNNADVVQAYLKEKDQDYIKFKTESLLQEAGDDPLKQSTTIKEIAETIAVIPDSVKRTMYAKSCAPRLGVDEPMMIGEVGRAVSRLEEERAKQKERERLYGKQGEQQPQQYQPQQYQPQGIQQPVQQWGNQGYVQYPHGYQQMPTQQQPQQTAQQPQQIAVPSDPYAIKNITEQIHKSERAIIEWVMFHGTEFFAQMRDAESGDAKTMNVAQYMAYDLELDEIKLTHPVFKEMLDIAKTFSPQQTESKAPDLYNTYTSTDQSREINEAAVSIYSDYWMNNHNISMKGEMEVVIYHAENTRSDVNNLLAVFKSEYLDQRKRQLEAEMIKAEKDGDTETLKNVSEEWMRMSTLKNSLDKEIGRSRKIGNIYEKK